MAKLTFNADDIEPWQGADQDGPATYALRLWLQFQNADEDMGLATACELAAFDKEVWEAFVERQPPCPRATTIMAGFEAAGVGVSFGVLG